MDLHPFRHINPGVGGEKLEITTRDLALVTIFTSLYAALVYIFAPISFFELQFRIAGVIRPGIAKKWILVIGYALGVVIGNLFSPFVGVYELLFMPTMSLVAGLLGYFVAKKFRNSYFVSGAVIATVISLSVSWMLLQLFELPIIATLPYLFISEQIVCLLGSVIFKAIETRVKWWQET
ncbi:MAG: QueT transporter family protein [Candidatus Bathyarchaeota archaeon]|nr:MAG: QueT transporter family protein [Candidatus Bathyarchaeota archaeon]